MENEFVRWILDDNEHIISHTGTSQYNSGAGISSCGLTALNFARVILTKADAGQDDILQEVIAKETAVMVSVPQVRSEYIAHHWPITI